VLDVVKLAPIDSDSVILKVQMPVVSLAQLAASGAFPTFQPWNANPEFGEATSVTVEPVARVPEQPLTGQKIVESVLITFPLPLGLIVTFNVTGGVTVPLTEKLNVGFAASLVVIVMVALTGPVMPAGGLKFTKSSPVVPGDTWKT
jgi:hypothetical protein